jgi:hypothetical protein
LAVLGNFKGLRALQARFLILQTFWASALAIETGERAPPSLPDGDWLGLTESLL